jgi:hypothetical protein
VAEALSGPFVIAALTLCVAGVAKLRSPALALNTLRAAHLPGGTGVIRIFALVELTLGIMAALSPGTVPAATLACLYAGFAALALVLHRRGAACGCFGDARTPASPSQSAISAALAALCAVAAVSHPPGVTWILNRSPAIATCLMIGIAGAVFATVVAYSELPAAWRAWDGR